MMDRNDKLHIACITYNINGRKTDCDQIYQMLDHWDIFKADLVVIGIQVCLAFINNYLSK